MATGANTVTKRRFANRLGEVLSGEYVFAGPEQRNIEVDIPFAPGVRYRVARGFGHIGARVFGRPYQYSIPSLETPGDTESPYIVITATDGGIMGRLRTDHQYPILKRFEFTEDKYGSADGKFVLNSLPDFSIQAGAIITLNFSGSANPIYRGIVKIPTRRGTDKGEYVFHTIGYRDNLKNMPATETVYLSGQDIGLIIDEVARYDVDPDSYISYNASNIDTTTGKSNAANIDMHTDNLIKTMDSLVNIVNVGASKFEWFVDTNGVFNFRQKTTTSQKIFFVGYNVGQVDVDENFDDIVNSWKITRKNSKATGGAGWSIANITDDEYSKAVYGLKQQTFQVPGYFDDSECQDIADSLLEESKDPRASAKIKDWVIRTEADLIPRGYYRIVFPVTLTERILTECEDSSLWTKTGAGDLAKSTELTLIQSGAGALKLTWTSATGDYAQTQDGHVAFDGFAQTIKMRVRQSRTGEIIQLGVGRGAWDDNTVNVTVNEANKYTEFIWDVSQLDIREINHIGFKVLDSASASTVYIDKIEVLDNNHLEYTFERTRVKYIFDSSRTTAEIELGAIPKRSYEWISSLIQKVNEAELAGEIR